ncbi:MAG: ABC transporter permease [Thermodesulfovibrionales bacterium]
MLLGVTLVTFFLVRALPGDPVQNMVGERSSPEAIERIRKEIGGDRNILQQYAGYLSLLLRGEMGRSLHTNRDVMNEITAKFPNTMKLAACAMALAAPLGIALGVAAALGRDRWSDRIISVFSVLGMSLPVFFVGLVLIFVFSLHLRLLPPSGTGGARYLVLPALTLAFPAAASFSRVTRVLVIDVLQQQYVRTALAKGLGTLHIQVVHVLKNALIPVATITGLEFASYLNGAVLTETIFGWDGIGRFAMEGILKRDYPVIMGCILTGTVVFLVMNLFVDVAYLFIDPRVRHSGENKR